MADHSVSESYLKQHTLLLTMDVTVLYLRTPPDRGAQQTLLIAGTGGLLGRYAPRPRHRENRSNGKHVEQETS